MGNFNSQKLNKSYSKFDVSLTVKFFGYIFIIFSLLPWVNFGLNNYDSQPWVFFSAVFFLLLILRKIILPINSLKIFIALSFGIIFTFINTYELNNFILFRALVGYFGILVLYIAFYNYFHRFGIPINLIIFFNFLWIFFAILQIYYPQLPIFSSSRSDLSTRGLTSLANEPSFFAIFLFFISWIYFECRNLIKKSNLIILLSVNFLVVIFLAKSLLVLLFYTFSLFSFSLIQLKNIKYNKILNFKFLLLIFYFSILIVVISIFEEYLFGSRVYNFINNLKNEEDLFLIIINDESILSRIESLYYSLVGTYYNYFLPGGLDSFIEMRREIFENNRINFFSNKYESNKIMSWLGTIFYELGIFGIFTIILIMKSIYRNFKGSFIYFATFFIILFASIPIGFSIIPMLIAIMVYNKTIEN